MMCAKIINPFCIALYCSKCLTSINSKKNDSL